MGLIVTAPDDIRPGDGFSKQDFMTAGVATAPFELHYIDKTDGNKLKKAINTTAEQATGLVMTLGHASPDENVAVLVPNGVGQIISATSLWAQSRAYIVGDVASQMMLEGDLTTGQFLTFVGWAVTDKIFQFNVIATGIQAP